MDWLATYQPRLVRRARRQAPPAAGLRLLPPTSRTAASRCSRAQRWALTGEAGVFLDPFYSPGSDFIAIAQHLHHRADRAATAPDEPVAPYAQHLRPDLPLVLRSTLALYTDQYPIFGDPEVMPVKVIWDYTYYWGVLCAALLPAPAHRPRGAGAPARRARALPGAQRRGAGAAARVVAREREAQRRADARPGRLPWFAELNRGLRDTLDDAGFKARLRETTAQLKALGAEIALTALADHPQLDVSEVRELLGEDLSRLAGSMLFPASQRSRSAAA